MGPQRKKRASLQIPASPVAGVFFFRLLRVLFYYSMILAVLNTSLLYFCHHHCFLICIFWKGSADSLLTPTEAASRRQQVLIKAPFESQQKHVAVQEDMLVSEVGGWRSECFTFSARPTRFDLLCIPNGNILYCSSLIGALTSFTSLMKEGYGWVKCQ